MEFTAKAIDLDLVLNSEKGDNKRFIPKKKVTAEFAESVLKEFNTYLSAQKELPESEQDRMVIANLKFLSNIYTGFDTEWVKKHFTISEIQTIRNEVFKGLVGVKKDEES